MKNISPQLPTLFSMCEWASNKPAYKSILCFCALVMIICPAQAQSEVEPNDSRDQAQEICLGESVRGQFQKERDEDWYKLIIDAPGKTLVQIDGGAIQLVFRSQNTDKKPARSWSPSPNRRRAGISTPGIPASFSRRWSRRSNSSLSCSTTLELRWRGERSAARRSR